MPRMAQRGGGEEEHLGRGSSSFKSPVVLDIEKISPTRRLYTTGITNAFAFSPCPLPPWSMPRWFTRLAYCRSKIHASIFSYEINFSFAPQIFPSVKGGRIFCRASSCKFQVWSKHICSHFSCETERNITMRVD